MAQLFTAVAQGQVKPKVASTLAYLSQTMLQSIPIAQHEYCEAFGTEPWRRAVRSSFTPPPLLPNPPLSHPLPPRHQRLTQLHLQRSNLPPNRTYRLTLLYPHEHRIRSAGIGWAEFIPTRDLHPVPARSRARLFRFFFFFHFIYSAPTPRELSFRAQRGTCCCFSFFQLATSSSPTTRTFIAQHTSHS